MCHSLRLIEYRRDAINEHDDCKHKNQMISRRRCLKTIDSFLAVKVGGDWYVVKILAGQTLSMYPNAMSCLHMQIHAEINNNGELVGKAAKKHWTWVFDEVIMGEFY